MRKLTPLDMAFLLAERRHQPFHVGALCLFQLPPDAPADFAEKIASRLRESRHAAPPFNRRLTRTLGMSAWVEADDFDLAQHFVHLSLPRPGRCRELLHMVSRIHSAHLDRAYPLWRIYLIEGLEDGRIALFAKIHHALVDGVAGVRLLLKSLTEDADASLHLPPPWDMPVTHRSAAATPDVDGASARARWLTDLAGGLRGAPAVAQQVWAALRDARSGRAEVVTSFQAPRCILNQRITGSRRFAVQSYATPRIKAVAQCFDATTNDIVLSLCGAALRHYLAAQNALPDAPLVAAVPVSIRRDDGTEGNQVTMALASLATDLADPLARVAAVKASMDRNKAVFRNMSPAELMAYSVASFVPGALTYFPLLGGQRTVANIVISHVPGPRQDMYWQGCRLDGVYPASIVLDGFALNITLVSRHDAVDVGIIGCRRTLPGVEHLPRYIDDALRELEAALGLPSYPPASVDPELMWNNTPVSAAPAETESARVTH